MNRKFRRTAFIWNKNFSDIINVFIITFDQFKASLLNKSINFYNFFTQFFFKLYRLQVLNGIVSV